MERINDIGLADIIRHRALVDQIPVLGICLGMQLLADMSEENGLHKGLGWISGTVKRIEGNPQLRVPHVGWNDIKIVNKAPLFERLQGNSNFYFDHSYHFKCNNEEDIAAKVDYDSDLVAAVQKKTIFTVCNSILKKARLRVFGFSRVF